MILCIGTTPAAQRVMIFPKLVIDHVNRATRTMDGIAGKSINVAKVLQVLGAQPFATGFLGGDRGEHLASSLSTRGIRSEFIKVAAPTRQCITVIDETTGTVTELVEESRPVEPADFEQLLEVIRSRIDGARAVVLSGTIASGGPSDFYLRCVQMAHRIGAISVVDAAGNALLEALKANPGLVKPNRPELEATVGRPLSSEEDMIAALRELNGRGAERIVVTAGAEPTLAFDKGKVWRIVAPEVKALNPIGSGDAFTAALTWRLTMGDTLGESCRWASAAGAANALTPMAGEVSITDIHALLPQVRVEQWT